MSAPLAADQRKRLMSHPAGWIATAFGAGLAPKAPGTAGSLVALLPWWFLLRDVPPGVYLAVLAAGFLLGVWACGVCDRRLGMHDQGALVWDEVIGMWITLFAAPTQWWWMIIGFALFRLFDIWKPWPVSWADRGVHGGLGVMLDDVVAGVYALVVLQLIALAVRNLA
jgi:phosphatidylglycerophosphatase A